MIRSSCLAGSFLVVLGASSMVLSAPVPVEDAKAIVKAYFSRIEKGGVGDTDPLFAPPAKDVITELGAYLGSESDTQQRRAVSLIAVIGSRSGDKEVRALAVKSLLDYAAGEGNGKRSERRPALEGLLKFSKADYPKEAGTEIEKLVRVDDPLPEALLLAGVVEVASVKDDLKKLAEVPKGENPFLNPWWSANLALARLGDAESVKHCVQVIEAEKDVSQQVRHFPDLTFIRHETALKVLTKHLMSEERMSSVREGTPGTKVALRALDLLTVSVEGFPIKRGRGPTYTEDQLAEARKWVKDQKELKLKR